MKEIEDIVLKKGDILYYKDGQICLVNPTEIQLDINTCNSIIKVLRPVKYETIYEAPKQILTKEEKEYLEEFIKVWELEDRLKSFIKIEVSSKICGIRQYVRAILKDDEKVMAVAPFDVDKHYKGIEPDKEYTLKELRLFEE